MLTDTNILLRYLVEDDPRQAASAAALIENDLSGENPRFVSLIVVVELARALRRAYRQSPAQIRATIAGLLDTTQLVIEQQPVIERALAMEHDELSDALIHEIGKAEGCGQIRIQAAVCLHSHSIVPGGLLV